MIENKYFTSYLNVDQTKSYEPAYLRKPPQVGEVLKVVMRLHLQHLTQAEQVHLQVEEDVQGVLQIQQGGVALDDNNTPLQKKMEEKSGHVEVAEYFELRLPVVLLELLALLVLC